LRVVPRVSLYQRVHRSHSGVVSRLKRGGAGVSTHARKYDAVVRAKGQL